MPAINLTRIQAVNITAIFIAGYFVVALCFIPVYFKWDLNAILGVFVIPYVCTVEKGRRSMRYLIPAIGFIVLAIMLPVNTLFFLAALFSVLLLMENSYGKVNQVLFFLLILVSPLFNNITRMGEFPVRLWLSNRVAAILSLSGKAATAAGNMITIDHYEFGVDPACAGLNMLATSLLICLLLFAFYQRKTGVKVRFWYVAAAQAVTVLLNIACNFFRIFLLVCFKVMPGDIFHDLVGIGCLIIYVLLPLLAGFNRAFKPHMPMKKPPVFVRTKQPAASLRYPFLHLVLFLSIIFLSRHISKADQLYHPAKNNLKLTGYTRKDLDGNIIKLESKEALIYLKPTAFYAPEHDPMVCWTGSGYVFKNVRQDTIKGKCIYTGLLQKGADKIYAAWWFDNGTTKTISQLNWRWHAAKGDKQFYLINANAADPVKLKLISEWLIDQKNILNN